jgi:uncharacterized protein (TIGR02118 family)
MFTMVYACRRIPGMTRAEYEAYYRDVHTPFARALPGLIEYRQMLVDQDFEWDGRTCEYDSVSTYVFPDQETARAAWASEAGLALEADTPLFMDWEAVLPFPGLEPRVFGPSA